MRPSSVRRPVAVTMASPVPSATTVPAKIMSVRSPIGASRRGTGARLLATGTDSPVSADSFVCNPATAIKRPSAGTS